MMPMSVTGGTAARRRRTTRTAKDDAGGCNWVLCDVMCARERRERDSFQPQETNRIIPSDWTLPAAVDEVVVVVDGDYLLEPSDLYIFDN